MGGAGKTLHFTQIYIIIPNDLYSGPLGINRKVDKKSMPTSHSKIHLMLVSELETLGLLNSIIYVLVKTTGKPFLFNFSF